MALLLISAHQVRGLLTPVLAIAAVLHQQLLPKNFVLLRRPWFGKIAWQASQDKPHPVDQIPRPELRVQHQYQYLQHAIHETPPYTMAWQWLVDPFLHSHPAANQQFHAPTIRLLGSSENSLLWHLPKRSDHSRNPGLIRSNIYLAFGSNSQQSTLHYPHAAHGGMK